MSLREVRILIINRVATFYNRSSHIDIDFKLKGSYLFRPYCSLVDMVRNHNLQN